MLRCVTLLSSAVARKQILRSRGASLHFFSHGIEQA